MGRVDVDGMLAEMTSSQYAEWMAFFALSPFGPLRDDLRFGTVAAGQYNTAFGRKTGAKSIRPSDFFESLAPPRKMMSQKEMASNLRAVTSARGGEFKTISRR